MSEKSLLVELKKEEKKLVEQKLAQARQIEEKSRESFKKIKPPLFSLNLIFQSFTLDISKSFVIIS